MRFHKLSLAGVCLEICFIGSVGNMQLRNCRGLMIFWSPYKCPHLMDREHVDSRLPVFRSKHASVDCYHFAKRRNCIIYIYTYVSLYVCNIYSYIHMVV